MTMKKIMIVFASALVLAACGTGNSAATTTTAFSATAGIGIKLNNVIKTIPLECGYRFFYLGKGHLNTLSDQVLNTLKTGDDYANAIICAVTF